MVKLSVFTHLYVLPSTQTSMETKWLYTFQLQKKLKQKLEFLC